MGQTSKEFGCKISTIWPGDSMKVGIQNKVFEGLSVLERFKYLSIKLILEVYFTFGPIAETKPQFVIRYVAGFFNSDHHYSKGEMAFSGRCPHTVHWQLTPRLDRVFVGRPLAPPVPTARCSLAAVNATPP